MPEVVVRDLHKSFGSVEVLRDVDMHIGDGEFVVLLGASGCGKSTLLNVIAGLEDATSGDILIDGRDVSELEPSERGVAMVFQTYALFPTMTVRGNLSFGLKVARTPRDEIARRVAEVAKLLQIEPLLDRRPSQLSGGQRQRVAIGRALVRSSKLCLFDEPLSNLDAKLRMETRGEIKRLHTELGMTVIYVTHDQVEAMTMADRVALINNGRIEQYDPPQVIYDRPATRFVADFVGSPSINFCTGALENDAGPVFCIGERRLPLRGYDFAGTDIPTGEAELGVRPDDLKIARTAQPDQPILSAIVTMVEPLGPDCLIWLEVQGLRWAMRLPTEDSTSIEGNVNLTFDPRRVSLFEQTSGQRL